VTSAPASEPEARIRSAFDQGELQEAATLLLVAYGGEILGFLSARLRDADMASDVFADFAEDLWRGMAGFRWNCSARAWAYTLARHAASRGIRQRRRRAARVVSLSRAGPLSEIAERICSETSRAMRSASRNRIAELRQRLSMHEQMLLMLRVNRGLAWLEIARIMAHGSLESACALSPEELSARAARLRKRFQKAKERLRRMAREAGLMPDSPPSS
jgi:RNA polymerase sigma-70 factor (ECF subfamily)